MLHGAEDGGEPGGGADGCGAAPGVYEQYDLEVDGVEFGACWQFAGLFEGCG